MTHDVKVVRGIVRHYYNEDETHTPYTGVLLKEDDKTELGQLCHGWLHDLLDEVEDGTAVEITVKFWGKHPNTKGYIWKLTKPHTYERVPKGRGRAR